MVFMPFNQDFTIGAVECTGSVYYQNETSVPTHIHTYRSEDEYLPPMTKNYNFFRPTSTAIEVTDNRTGSVIECRYYILPPTPGNNERSRVFQQKRIRDVLPSTSNNPDGRITMRWGVDFDVPGALLSKIYADPTVNYPAETIDGTITLLTSGPIYEGATDNYATNLTAFPLDKKLITKTLDIDGNVALYPLITTTFLYVQQSVVPITPPTCTGTCSYRHSNIEGSYGFRFTINVGAQRFKTTSNGNRAFAGVQA